MATEIKPTRSELIKLKAKIKLAKSGHNLLKKKRDGLILEFFDILKKAKTVRKELVEEYKTALHNMNIARAAESDLKLRSIALAISRQPKIKLETKNIMGVKVPKIQTESEEKSDNRGYGLISGSAKIDEAAEAYEKVVEKIILAAEVETSMKKLLIEIEKTKRRVNALEFKVIPELTEIQTFIQFRLEEMERESIFRLKHIKKKMEIVA